jgi:hypothetical protein
MECIERIASDAITQREFARACVIELDRVVVDAGLALYNAWCTRDRIYFALFFPCPARAFQECVCTSRHLR